MIPLGLLKRDLLYYRKSALALLLVTILSTAVLTGALLAGSSIRGSLEQLTDRRLGSAVWAVSAKSNLFRAALSEHPEHPEHPEYPELEGFAPVFRIRGSASATDTGIEIKGIDIYGVDSRFWDLGEESPDSDGSQSPIYINQAAASRLGLSNGSGGQELLLRMEKPGAMAVEAPLSPFSTGSVSLRATVKTVLGEESMGLFSTEAHQVPSPALFLPLESLTRTLGIPGKANLLLLPDPENSFTGEGEIRDIIKDRYTLEDAQLYLERSGEKGEGFILSNRVFIDPMMEELLLAVETDSVQAASFLSYFVNAIETEGASTPYSFSGTASGLQTGEIILSDWAAEDLGISEAGETVQLRYFVPSSDSEAQLEEKSRSFKVAGIIPLSDPLFISVPVPDFPGIAEAASCAEWSPGIPVDLEKIREKDELFWENHRTTPKALVSGEDAREMWGNRFGNATAISYTASSLPDLERELAAAEKRIAGRLPGLEIRNLREEAGFAVGGAVDFSMLFLGMSFFLILAAVLLAGLVYSLFLENRRSHISLLLSLGYTKKHLGKLLFIEAFVLAAAGGILGVPVGIAFTRLLLFALSTIWSGAVGTSALVVHIASADLLIGFIGGLSGSLLGMAVPLGKKGRAIAATLAGVEDSGGSLLRRIPWWAPLPFFSAAGILILFSLQATGGPYIFFPAGGLLLLGWALLAGWFLSPDKKSLPILRGIRRNGKQNLAALVLLAAGVFMVTAVGANRRDPFSDAASVSSGTGGFDYYIRSSLPLPRDFAGETGRYRYGLETFGREELVLTGLRLSEGDDADCLNVYQAQHPGLLGGDFSLFARRGSFTFLKSPGGDKDASPWDLDRWNAADSRRIPGILDHSVLLWGLGASLGDVITYIDESGEPFEVELAASLEDSVFQGSILIREEDFLRFFPSSAGYNIILADLQDPRAEEMEEQLARAFRPYGVEIQSSGDRLAMFLEVENTYLSMFLLLGGLGLLLGSLGTGLVVLKNLSDRQSEIALLRTLGYPRRRVKYTLFREYMAVSAAGIGAGALSALVAAAPSIADRRAPLGFIGGGITILFILAALVIYAATASGMKKDFYQALRQE